jgi:hypothetical protein
MHFAFQNTPKREIKIFCKYSLIKAEANSFPIKREV